MKIETLGWNHFFQEQFQKYESNKLFPGRIITKQGNTYMIFHEEGNIVGNVTGKFKYDAKAIKDYPVVGDWVLYELKENFQALIYVVLPRQSAFARKLAISVGRKMKNGILDGGLTEEQIIAANIDVAFSITLNLDAQYRMQSKME